MRIERVKEIIAGFKGKRVAVIGDLILDGYVWGKVTRISQEAPVPVVHALRKTYSLGGAANVMRNVTSLGAQVAAFGVVGQDLAGETLKRMMADEGIDTRHVSADNSGRVTIEKQRVIAGSQHLARIDYEDLAPVSEQIRASVVATLKQMVADGAVDAIIFEDYAKGLLKESMLAETLAAAKPKGVVVALDPHPKHHMDVKGLTLMTPNLLEAKALSGLYTPDMAESEAGPEEIAQIAAKLDADLQTEKLLITLGSKGMALFDRGKLPVTIPTRAKEVFDVTGAGDTVIATFTLALLAGASGVEAAELSNHAAGIVVGKVGTAAVSPDELLAAFAHE